MPNRFIPHLPDALALSSPAIHSEEVFERYALLERLLKLRCQPCYSEKRKRGEGGEREQLHLQSVRLWINRHLWKVHSYERVPVFITEFHRIHIAEEIRLETLGKITTS